MSGSEDRSESGERLFRHQRPDAPGEMADGDSVNIEAISSHIETHIGPVATVFHELISPHVHIDVHIVAPTEERPVYTLITSGMSDRPMKVPEGLEEYRYAELMLCLPPDWPMEQENWKDENNYWPIRALKFLARFPHEYNTWLFVGHSVPNGNPAKAFGNTGFTCSLITAPGTITEECFELHLSPEKVIRFYGVGFLYPEEVAYKLKHGEDMLFERLEAKEFDEILDVTRENVAKKRFGFF